jgi:hypothetical protein
MLQAYNHKEDLYPPFLWNLWMILGIELWFKTVFLNRSNLKLEDNTHDIGIAAEVA